MAQATVTVKMTPSDLQLVNAALIMYARIIEEVEREKTLDFSIEALALLHDTGAPINCTEFEDVRQARRLVKELGIK